MLFPDDERNQQLWQDLCKASLALRHFPQADRTALVDAYGLRLYAEVAEQMMHRAREGFEDGLQCGQILASWTFASGEDRFGPIISVAALRESESQSLHKQRAAFSRQKSKNGKIFDHRETRSSVEKRSRRFKKVSALWAARAALGFWELSLPVATQSFPVKAGNLFDFLRDTEIVRRNAVRQHLPSADEIYTLSPPVLDFLRFTPDFDDLYRRRTFRTGFEAAAPSTINEPDRRPQAA
jgi:hypothetical protein